MSVPCRPPPPGPSPLPRTLPPGPPILPGAALFLLAAVLVCCQRAPAPVGSRVVIAVPYEMDGLDPHASNTVSSYAVLSNVYEPLVWTDEDLRVQPALAASWESPDPLTWIFHLRPGVVFHSGKPLTSRDVVFSLNRLLQHTELQMRSYLVDVSEVRATDDSTVEIRTRRPARLLLNRLNFVLIVPESSSGEHLNGRSDGTGSYALADWRTGTLVRLRRHERHWAPSAALRDVDILLGRPAEDAVEGLLAGRYQLIQFNSKALAARLPNSDRHESFLRESLYVKYLGYDLSRDVTPFCRVVPNPFRNRLVRRALSAAVDRRRLAASLSSQAVPASQPLPRFVFGFDPTLGVPEADPDRAKALLREAGLPGGFAVTLQVRWILREAAERLKEQLGPVGIRIDVQVLRDPEFFKAMSRREGSFWLSRWGCPSGDVIDLLQMVIHSPDPARGLGLANYAGYQNPELDRAIEASGDIEKSEDRQKADRQILRTLTSEVLLVPLYFDEDIYVIDRRLAWRPRNDSYIRAAEISVR